MTAGPSYGVFSCFWGNGVPRHLALLRLDDDKATHSSLTLLSEIMIREGSAEGDLHSLLSDKNWRPQLVGATALALGWGDESHRRDVWRLLESGSWVTPQLAAALVLAEPRFKELAPVTIERILADGTNAPQPLESWARLHSERGPGSRYEERAKTIAALVELLGHDGPWVQQNSRRDDIRELLASDTDSGGQIAIRWKERMVVARRRYGTCRG